MIVALKVAKAGYYNGDPDKVLQSRVDHVLMILDYEKFSYDYQDVYDEINKPSK